MQGFKNWFNENKMTFAGDLGAEGLDYRPGQVGAQVLGLRGSYRDVLSQCISMDEFVRQGIERCRLFREDFKDEGRVETPHGEGWKLGGFLVYGIVQRKVFIKKITLAVVKNEQLTSRGTHQTQRQGYESTITLSMHTLQHDPRRVLAHEVTHAFDPKLNAYIYSALKGKLPGGQPGVSYKATRVDGKKDYEGYLRSPHEFDAFSSSDAYTGATGHLKGVIKAEELNGLETNVPFFKVGDQVKVQSNDNVLIGTIDRDDNGIYFLYRDRSYGRKVYLRGRDKFFGVFKILPKGTKIQDRYTGEVGTVANDNSAGLFVAWDKEPDRVTGAGHPNVQVVKPGRLVPKQSADLDYFQTQDPRLQGQYRRRVLKRRAEYAPKMGLAPAPGEDRLAARAAAQAQYHQQAKDYQDYYRWGRRIKRGLGIETPASQPPQQPVRQPLWGVRPKAQ